MLLYPRAKGVYLVRWIVLRIEERGRERKGKVGLF